MLADLCEVFEVIVENKLMAKEFTNNPSRIDFFAFVRVQKRIAKFREFIEPLVHDPSNKNFLHFVDQNVKIIYAEKAKGSEAEAKISPEQLIFDGKYSLHKFSDVLTELDKQLTLIDSILSPFVRILREMLINAELGEHCPLSKELLNAMFKDQSLEKKCPHDVCFLPPSNASDHAFIEMLLEQICTLDNQIVSFLLSNMRNYSFQELPELFDETCHGQQGALFGENQPQLGHPHKSILIDMQAKFSLSHCASPRTSPKRSGAGGGAGGGNFPLNQQLLTKFLIAFRKNTFDLRLVLGTLEDEPLLLSKIPSLEKIGKSNKSEKGAEQGDDSLAVEEFNSKPSKRELESSLARAEFLINELQEMLFKYAQNFDDSVCAAGFVHSECCRDISSKDVQRNRKGKRIDPSPSESKGMFSSS